MTAIECVVETALYADDLVAAERFYHGILGLAVRGREAGRHVFFQVGDRDMLLVFAPETTLRGETLPAHGARGPGHVALGVASGGIDEWRVRLRQHGVAVEHEESWPGGGLSLYFRDPAGNSVELITRGVWGLPSGW